LVTDWLLWYIKVLNSVAKAVAYVQINNRCSLYCPDENWYWRPCEQLQLETKGDWNAFSQKTVPKLECDCVMCPVPTWSGG